MIYDKYKTEFDKIFIEALNDLDPDLLCTFMWDWFESKLNEVKDEEYHNGYIDGLSDS